LLYLRNHDGDSGFRSNNKLGDENASEDFMLSNGQLDEYPETWIVSKDKIKTALLTYFDLGTMDENINWYEEN
jgi:hypothetical protein